MKNCKHIFSLFALILLTTFSACIKDLDTVPLDDDEITATFVYQDEDSYRQILAKIYGGLFLTGQRAPSDLNDIVATDAGASSYIRAIWVAQEISTDEAITNWQDPGLPFYNYQTWTASNPVNRDLYNRIFFHLTLCNDFIRETSNEKLEERNIQSDFKVQISIYRAEVRFLRALSYWYLLDLFQNVPFVTDEDFIGSFLPEQTNANDLFNYIESELLEIESQLVDARQNEYARADKAAAWTLLAKLYLNAPTYINQDKNTECITYCDKVIDAGYSLEPVYEHLFLTDNHTSSEIIFPIACDGQRSQSWGGTTFLVHAPVGGAMNPDDYGINGGWEGIRTTKQFVEKFEDPSGATDTRASFFTTGQSLEIDTIASFTNGYAIEKFKNIDREGNPGSDPEGNHADTDYPLFRLADIYLMYAEAVLRGGSGGSESDALNYLNELRERAYQGSTGNISSYDLNYILDERARELYWEGHRRTDLIRFRKYTGSEYVWAWKGQVKEGTGTSTHLDLFPIPASDIIANPNLIQNDGY